MYYFVKTLKDKNKILDFLKNNTVWSFIKTWFLKIIMQIRYIINAINTIC